MCGFYPFGARTILRSCSKCGTEYTHHPSFHRRLAAHCRRSRNTCHLLSLPWATLHVRVGFAQRTQTHYVGTLFRCTPSKLHWVYHVCSGTPSLHVRRGVSVDPVRHFPVNTRQSNRFHCCGSCSIRYLFIHRSDKSWRRYVEGGIRAAVGRMGR